MEGIVTEKKKKVAIVGCSDSKNLAPFNDQSFEIWGVNNLFYHIPRYDRWFEIHSIKKEGEQWYRRGNIDLKVGKFDWSTEFRGQNVNKYVGDLSKLTCPIYMQNKWDEIPTSEPYPLQAIKDTFGGYFTNTVSYMLALAIYEGFEEIHVYGVDMAVSTEYYWQRPSCEYFLGIAIGRGIKVYIPPEADLLKTRFLYAFEEKERDHWEKKVASMTANMNQRKAQAEQEFTLAQRKIEQYIGALEAIKEVNKIWE